MNTCSKTAIFIIFAIKKTLKQRTDIPFLIWNAKYRNKWVDNDL